MVVGSIWRGKRIQPVIKSIIPVLITILVLMIIYMVWRWRSELGGGRENFENSSEEEYSKVNIDGVRYEVIHMIGKEDRMNNIRKQEGIAGIQMNIFDAVVGSGLDLEKLQNDGLVKRPWDTFRYNNASNEEAKRKVLNGEIGCYMSHLELVKKIRDSDYEGWTVIFEDDLSLNGDFKKELQKIIGYLQKDTTRLADQRSVASSRESSTRLADQRSVASSRDMSTEGGSPSSDQIDIVFIGSLGQENCDNGRFKENLCYATNFWGTQGYMINKKSAAKIYEHIKYIDQEIDQKYRGLVLEKKINGLIVIPTMVKQIGADSTIV